MNPEESRRERWWTLPKRMGEGVLLVLILTLFFLRCGGASYWWP